MNKPEDNLLKERTGGDVIDRLTSGERKEEEPQFAPRSTSGPSAPSEEPNDTPTGITKVKPEEKPPEPEEKEKEKEKEKEAIPSEEEPESPLVMKDSDWLPERVDAVLSEIALGGELTKVSITGVEDGDPSSGGGKAGANSADASGSSAVSTGPGGFSELAALLKRTGYPEPCYKYITNPQQLTTIAGAVAVLIPFLQMQLFPGMIARNFAASFAKGAASKIKKMGKWGAIVAAAIGTGVAINSALTARDIKDGVQKFDEGTDEAMLTLLRPFLPDKDLVNPKCVIVSSAILAGISSAIMYFITAAGVKRLGAGSVTAILKLKSLNTKILSSMLARIIKKLKAGGEETKKVVEKSTREALEEPEARDILEELPEGTKEWLLDDKGGFFWHATLPGTTSADITKLLKEHLDLTDPNQARLADELMDKVFKRIDNDYQITSLKRAERAERGAAKASRQHLDTVKEARGQMNLDIPGMSGPEMTMVDKLMNKAFDSNDISEAARLLDDIVATSRKRGFIDGPLRNKEEMIEFAAAANKKMADIGSPEGGLDALSYLLDRVKTDAKDLRIDLENMDKFTGRAAKDISSSATDAEVKSIVRKRIEDLSHHISKDLPLDPEKVEETAAKVTEINNKTEEIVEQVVKATEKKAGIGLTAPQYLEVAAIVMGIATIETSRALKFPNPSDAPWFFEGSVLDSYINTVNGRKDYQKLETTILNNDKASREFLNLVYDPQNENTAKFIDDVSRIRGVEIDAEELIDFSKNKIKDLAELHRESIIKKLEEEVPAGELYGSDDSKVQARKKTVMFRLISEMFLYNKGLFRDLNEYFNDVIKRGDDYIQRNRKIDLENIFNKKIAAGKRFESKKKKADKFTNPAFNTTKAPNTDIKEPVGKVPPGVKLPTPEQEKLLKAFFDLPASASQKDFNAAGDAFENSLYPHQVENLRNAGELTTTAQVLKIIAKPAKETTDEAAKREFPIVDGKNWVKPMNVPWKAKHTSFSQQRGKGQHNAIDIGFNSPIDAPVVAAASGKVTKTFVIGYKRQLKAYATEMNNRIRNETFVNDVKKALAWGAEKLPSRAAAMTARAGQQIKNPKTLAPVDGDWESFAKWSRDNMPTYVSGENSKKTFSDTLLRYYNSEDANMPRLGIGGQSITILTDPDQHGNTFKLYYGHLNSVSVSEGATVKAGDVIGGMGSTSVFDNKHLHFAVRIKDSFRAPGFRGDRIRKDATGQMAIDPESVIPSLGGGRTESLYIVEEEKLATQQKEVKQMSKLDIRQLVAEVLNENYGKYDYNSNEYTEDEPNEDYQVEWSAMIEEVCGPKKKNVDGDPKTFEDAAVEVAKILVKDSDLFRDVLEMAGSNKSIGVEIMQQLKAAKEKKTLDKEMDV